MRNDIQIVYAEKLHSTAVGSCCQHTLNQPSATELKGKVYYSNIFIILVPRKEREEEKAKKAEIKRQKAEEKAKRLAEKQAKKQEKENLKNKDK